MAVDPRPDDNSWHQSAAEWWIAIGAAGDGQRFEMMPQATTVPVRWSGQAHGHPPDEPAQGVVLRAAGDRLAIDAEEAGWAWVRVPWDRYWASASGTPVLKGGPGHLVVWANRGTTELRWSVPGTVDAAAAAVTGVALLSAASLSIINRRRGWDSDPGHSRPAAAASEVYAVTVDGWKSSRGRNPTCDRTGTGGWQS